MSLFHSSSNHDHHVSFTWWLIQPYRLPKLLVLVWNLGFRGAVAFVGMFDLFTKADLYVKGSEMAHKCTQGKSVLNEWNLAQQIEAKEQGWKWFLVLTWVVLITNLLGGCILNLPHSHIIQWPAPLGQIFWEGKIQDVNVTRQEVTVGTNYWVNTLIK